MSTGKLQIVIPGDDPVQIGGSPHLDRLRDKADVTLHKDRPADDAEKLRRVQDADIIINSRSNVHWSAEELAQLPQLKMMTTCSIGTDAIDLEAAKARGVVVSNVPGKTRHVVAEHALALMLGVARRLAFQTAEMKQGRWAPRKSLFLRGKTLGVIGTGAIGCAVIELGQAIGMDVVAWSFNPDPAKAQEFGFRYVELDELLQTSNVVSLHVRLTPQSRGLIGERELALMQPGAILINTARGPVVDTAALIASLNAGHLGGAGVDVFDIEPLPADSPILGCEQIVLTPHAADQTPEGTDFLNGGAVENVLAFLNGKPSNVVN